MNIRQIENLFIWSLHFGLGRKGILSAQKHNMLQRVNNAIKDNKRIVPSDVVGKSVWKNKEEDKLIAQVCELGNMNICQEKVKKEIIEQIRKSMLSDKIKVDILNILESFAIICGLYQLAFELRKSSECRLIKKYEKRKKIRGFDVIPLFWSYISSNENEKAKNVIKRCGKVFLFFFGKEIQYLTTLLNNGDACSIIKKGTLEDQKFSQLITGKKVLILGPLQDTEQLQQYIDECDVVISMTYRRNLVTSIGGKEHISYYNGQAVHLLGEEKLDQYMHDLDMAVFKEIQFPYQERMLHDKCARKAYGGIEGLYDKKDRLYFQFLYAIACECNLLQRILLDIILFKPQKIWVVNANLHLGKKRYNDKYVIAEGLHSLFKDRAAFATHNMINMYQMTKLLYDCGIIEVDSELKEVLNIGLEKYMQGMQELEQ